MAQTQSHPALRDRSVLSVAALAMALVGFGFAVGQTAPNVVELIGTTLDSAETDAVAPALTKADDYATRHSEVAPALTKADDYATRHSEVAPALTKADDYATRHSGQ